MSAYPEDETQALIALAELEFPIDSPNNNSYKPFPGNMAEARTYFRRFAVDLSTAFSSLRNKGLVRKERDRWFLTPSGRDAAVALRELRPPIYYWYKDFYTAIEKSPAFSEYSRRVLGKDLGQHGFSDLNQIHRLLEIIKLDRSSRVLDVGCGNGKIAEYISDLTQASVTGIDYVPEAIAQAAARTQNKKDRLHFRVANLETPDYGDESFDLVLSIDSIYFGSLKAILTDWKKIVKPGGRMAIFYLGMSGDNLSDSLKENGLSYEIYDISRENYELQQLKHRVVSELRTAFEEEGNTFVWQNLMNESVSSPEPYGTAELPIRRYLYIVEKA